MQQESTYQDMNRTGREGSLTKKIEKQTSKIPSVAFLGLAVSSMAVSFALATIMKRKGTANFIGMWAPTFLLLGIYNKIVKTEGSDQAEKGSPFSASDLH